MTITIPLAAFALGTVLSVAAIRSLGRVLARRSWLAVDARVTSCDLAYVHADEEFQSTVGPFNAPPVYTAQVEYLVDGARYGAQLTLTHPPAEATVLYVNPTQPSETICEKPAYWAVFWLAMFALGCLAVGSGLGMSAL